MSGQFLVSVTFRVTCTRELGVEKIVQTVFSNVLSARNVFVLLNSVCLRKLSHPQVVFAVANVQNPCAPWMLMYPCTTSFLND